MSATAGNGSPGSTSDTGRTVDGAGTRRRASSSGGAAEGASRPRRKRTRVDLSGRTGARGGAGAAWPGFWLPAPLRKRFIGRKTIWQEATFLNGRRCDDDCPPDTPGTVTVRWPAFGPDEWTEIAAALAAARDKAPRGPEYWTRLKVALAATADRLADPTALGTQGVIAALSSCTGYSKGMVAAALGAPDSWDLEQLVPALRYQPSKVCGAEWRGIPGLQGKVRFFPDKPFDKAAGWTPVAWEMPLYGTDIRPRIILGSGSGDIPGSTSRILWLALSTTLRGEAPLPRPEPPPVVLLRESPQEPILTPHILAAIEELDSELVSMVATGLWDHGDPDMQERLVPLADLVIATGVGDDIPAFAPRTASTSSSPRVHQHGPKVSFTVISREVLGAESESVADDRGRVPPGDTEIIDIVALLAGLDSVMWDQNGSHSSRMHFVETGGPEDDFPAEYARRLVKRLRQIEEVMPRGPWPVRHLHDAFDRYEALEGADRWGTGLQVMSDYDDPFVVVLDGRTPKEAHLDRHVFASLVDDCRTRVVVVRPVDDIMEVPQRYLRLLPRQSLQTMTVASGRPVTGLTREYLAFAFACGRQGVTAIHTVGRGAYPGLAHSWDGLLPADLVGTRPAGHFTTIGSDSPFDDMMATYQAILARLAKLPPADERSAPED